MSLWPVVLLLVLLVVAGGGVGRWWGTRRRRLVPAPTQPILPAPVPEPCPSQRCDDELDWAGVDFRIESLPDLAPMHPRSLLLADQPVEWRRRMRAHGERLEGGWVAELTFVHGTFVGSDPFSLLHRFGRRSPTSRWSGPLRALMKTASDRVARDAGNFDPRWLALFEAATGVRCANFVWSSENTHLARLEAAIALARHLDRRFAERPDAARGFLIGHSHAGQVFALLLQLIHRVEHAPALLDVLELPEDDRTTIQSVLARLGEVELRVVTLGAPVRYGWPQAAHRGLLHLINHRGREPKGGRLDGIPTTRDGDYVQQWGITGSDLPLPAGPRRDRNRVLERLLGPGYAPRTWLDGLKHRRRVHQGGRTLLVDYRDDAAQGRPNFLETGFGHAIYTRRRTMEFLASTIAGELGG